MTHSRDCWTSPKSLLASFQTVPDDVIFGTVQYIPHIARDCDGGICSAFDDRKSTQAASQECCNQRLDIQ